jgi:hypothetical protein
MWSWLAPLLPIVMKPLLAMVDRAFKNWKTSATGTAAGLMVLEYLKAVGCDPAAANLAALAPLLVGLISHDKRVTIDVKETPHGTVSTIAVGEQVDKDGKPIP